jgi:hypothetical protein
MNRRRSIALLLLVVYWCSIMGCSRSGRPATAPVRGQVIYQGKAVAGATVTFLCPGAPRLAIGTTDDAGNYRLSTFETDDGAVIGTHVVAVKKESPELEQSVDTEKPIDSKSMSKAIEQAMRQSARQIEKAEKSKPLLPAKYADRHTSDIRKEVVEGDNVINIELSN